MKPIDPFPKLLHAFFYEWMVQQRNASVHTDDGGSDGNAQMGFAGSGPSSDILPGIGRERRIHYRFHPRFGEMALPLIHGCVGEDEAVEVLQHRELGAADAIADRSSLTVIRSARIRLAMSG